MAPLDAKVNGGGRIRTFEGIRQQIYSLPPLATWVTRLGPVLPVIWNERENGKSTASRHHEATAGGFDAQDGPVTPKKAAGRT